MRIAIAAALVLLTGCASAPVRPIDIPRLDAADRRMREGCYRCLLEARDAYAQMAAAGDAARVAGRLFEVTLLIALREAELGQDASASFAQADALGATLPPAADTTFLLALARAIPADVVGTPRARARAALNETRAFLKRESADLPARLEAAAVSPEVRAYLAASYTCLTAAAGARSGVAPSDVLSPTLSPLVRYRHATCPAARSDWLDEVVAEVPAFVEAAYVRARMPTLRITTDHVRQQRAAFEAAHLAFPDSPSVAYSLGTLNQTVGDCRTALTHYDRTLVLAPLHEDAALQRIICLGHLGRYENAITAATTVIDAAYDNAEEALYWRAWNRHWLRRLPDAREDIDRALGQRVNARNLTLGGIIKYDQRDLALAEQDLSRAVEMDRTQCLAQWYLGLVGFAREIWISTGEDFAAAAACYRRSADDAERQLAAVQDADLDPDFRASQIAGFRAAIADDRSQEQASYLNAANGFVRSDNGARAREMLAAIPDDSIHAPGARELRRYLDELDAPAR